MQKGKIRLSKKGNGSLGVGRGRRGKNSFILMGAEWEKGKHSFILMGGERGEGALYISFRTYKDNRL